MLEGRLELTKGQVRWWSPAPAVFCSEVKGHIGVEGIPPLIDGFHVAVAQAPARKVGVFHDWSGVTGYDSDTRVLYTAQAMPLMPSVEFIDALVPPQLRLLAMAIEVAKIVLRTNFSATTDRAVFERHRAEVMAAATRNA